MKKVTGLYVFIYKNRRFFTVVRFQAAILSMLFAIGCIPQTPIPNTSVPTIVVPSSTLLNLETPTGTLPAVATGTISPELIEVTEIILTAIETNQPDMLRSIIGDEGVAVVGFAQGAKFKGFNNSDEIVAAFADALPESTPICEGFAPESETLSDKAILVYQGIKFDWNKFGFSESNSDGRMTLQLFKLPDGWRFVYITPLNPEWISHLGPLQECP